MSSLKIGVHPTNKIMLAAPKNYRNRPPEHSTLKSLQ